MIRRAIVKAWFKRLWDDEKRLARESNRKYHETGDYVYRVVAEEHAEMYEKLRFVWDSMRIL